MLQTLHADDPEIASSYVSNGTLLREIGAVDEAIRELSHGVEILEKRPTDTRPLASARFALAGALWDGRRDRARAVALAQTAQRDLAAAGKDAEAERGEVDAWLAARPRTR
jgi:hypothetical protein